MSEAKTPTAKAKGLADGIEVWCQFEKLAPVSELKPNPRNPNKHPEGQIELLAKNIRYFGWRHCISVSNRSGCIVSGHGRLLAAQKLGAKLVPVDFQDFASEDEEMAVLVSDNRLAELAEPSQDELKSILQELDGKLDMDLTGFDQDSLDDILQKFEEPDTGEQEIPEPPAEAITKPGDLYELGPHRLLCGDSTKSEDVIRLMNGERAILFATDPPYLVNYDGSNRPQKGGHDGGKDWSDSYGCTWDEANAENNSELYDRFIKAAIEHAILPNAAWYCWHASKRQKMVEETWEKNGAFAHQQIVWVKNRPLIARTWYMWRHEPCFFGWLKGNKPPRAEDLFLHSVWEIEGLKGEDRPDHPTPKPLECFMIPMRQHTRKGDLCYEPFAGSGSQFIAGEKLGRRVFGMEISPRYCDVIVRRWLNLGEGRQVLLNGEDVTGRFAQE